MRIGFEIGLTLKHYYRNEFAMNCICLWQFHRLDEIRAWRRIARREYETMFYCKETML